MSSNTSAPRLAVLISSIAVHVKVLHVVRVIFAFRHRHVHHQGVSVDLSGEAMVGGDLRVGIVVFCRFKP